MQTAGPEGFNPQLRHSRSERYQALLYELAEEAIGVFEGRVSVGANAKKKRNDILKVFESHSQRLEEEFPDWEGQELLSYV